MRIAIITPGFLPVPDIKGAAVETLISHLIYNNEKIKKCDFDLYTLESETDISIFNKTNIITIKNNFLEKFLSRVFNYISNKFSLEYNINCYFNKTVKEMNKRDIFYDYIIIENNMYGYKTIYKNYKKKSKFVFHLHNDIGGLDKPISLCKYIAKTSYKVLTVSNYIKKRFEINTGCKAHILFNCIDENKFNIVDETFVKEIYLKHNIDINKKTFIYIGRIEREKGPLELIKAFLSSELLEKNAQLLIVGSVWYNKKIKNKYYDEIIKYSNKSKNIFLIGGINHDKVSSIFELADVCIIPTMCEEAFGMVALEAMVKRKPLIVSDSGGLKEIVDDTTPIVNRNNIIYELKLEMENYFIKNKEELSNLGEKQYIHYKRNTNFNSELYLDSLIDIIKS